MRSLNWHGYGLLDIIEELAADYGNISSEEELSELFDQEIAPLVIAEYGKDDEPAMNEAFNNWADSLYKEGDIHEEQYNNYVYVGEYAND